MSKWVKCEDCGELKEVPAYEGDGAYHVHYCPIPDYKRRVPESEPDDEVGEK